MPMKTTKTNSVHAKEERKGNKYECAIKKNKTKNHAKPTTQPITNKYKASKKQT